MEQWGDAGPVPCWAFKVDSVLGTKHDIVCDILSLDGDSGHALVSLYPCRTRARIMSGFPQVSSDVVSVAIIGAEYVDGMGMPGFRINNAESVISHPRIAISDFSTAIELCCGIGVGTFGLEAAGVKVAVAVDWNAKMLEGYASLHPGVP